MDSRVIFVTDLTDPGYVDALAEAHASLLAAAPGPATLTTTVQFDPERCAYRVTVSRADPRVP